MTASKRYWIPSVGCKDKSTDRGGGGGPVKMSGVRMAIIGAAGHMGKRFVNILATHPEVSLEAVADINREGIDSLPAAEGVKRYADYSEMLDAHPGIEAVIVATPDGVHRDPCVACFERGFHVLVEKPLADSVEDALAIARAARRSQRVLLVGHTLRFDARYVQARDAVAAGEIGEVVFMAARRNDFLRSPYRIGGRTSPIFFLGVHDIDVFQWFCGERAARVSAVKVTKRLQELGVEDGVFLRVQFPSGCVATLEASWLLPDSMGKSDSQLEVVGTKGSLFIDGYFTGLRIHGEAGWRQPDTVLVPMLYGKLSGALRFEVDHFLDCVSGRSAPAISPDEALSAVRVAVTALRSAEKDGATQLVSE